MHRVIFETALLIAPLHHWDAFIREPEELASFTDTRVAGYH